MHCRHPSATLPSTRLFYQEGQKPQCEICTACNRLSAHREKNHSNFFVISHPEFSSSDLAGAAQMPRFNVAEE